MLHKQAEKVVYMVGPNQTVATNATSSSRVDRLGFDYATIEVVMPVATATNSSATFASLKLTESDTTTASTTAVSGFLGGTDFTIPTQNDTSNPQITRFNVNCTGRKRYLFVILQGAASHNNIVVKADLCQAEQMPATDAARGVTSSTVTTVNG